MAGETARVSREELEGIHDVLEEAHAYHVARAEAKRAEGMRPDAELPSLAVELGIRLDRIRRLLADVTVDLDGPPVFGIDLLTAEFVGQLLEHKGWRKARLYAGSRAALTRAQRLADDVTGPLAGLLDASAQAPAEDGIRTVLAPEQWMAVPVA